MRYAAVLWLTVEVDDLLADLMESPSGTVAKKLPDRTLSDEVRTILDARAGPNSGGRVKDHPPAGVPRHRGLARLALWWAARQPGVRCVISKLDVARAFRWHDFDPEDTPEFGTRLPGSYPDCDDDVLVIYLVMPFGWMAAPGEFAVWAWAVKIAHGRVRPPKPWVNDTVCFESKWLADDGVTLEPLLGCRPWLSRDEMEATMRTAWGADAVNAAKREEEGQCWRRRSAGACSSTSISTPSACPNKNA
jgi:hypothetical protein